MRCPPRPAKIGAVGNTTNSRSLPRWAMHPVFVGFVFTHISAAVRVTKPMLALKMISRVRCVEPNDYIGRAMLLRLLLVRKGHHPYTERRADGQENPEHREHAVSDSPRHHLPPVLRE